MLCIQVRTSLFVTRSSSRIFTGKATKHSTTKTPIACFLKIPHGELFPFPVVLLYIITSHPTRITASANRNCLKFLHVQRIHCVVTPERLPYLVLLPELLSTYNSMVAPQDEQSSL